MINGHKILWTSYLNAIRIAILKCSLISDPFIDYFIRLQLEYKVLNTTCILVSIQSKHRSTVCSEHMIIIILDQKEITVIHIIWTSVIKTAQIEAIFLSWIDQLNISASQYLWNIFPNGFYLFITYYLRSYWYFRSEKDIWRTMLQYFLFCYFYSTEFLCHFLKFYLEWTFDNTIALFQWKVQWSAS